MIKILDNLTSKSNVNHLEQILLNHPWYYLKDTAYNRTIDDHTPYEMSWVHFLYNEEESLSDLKPLAEAILIKALDQANLPISKLIRIRAGMSTRTPYPVRHTPHVDWDDNHMSAVYYVNDADGDTVFFKETRDETLSINSYEWGKHNAFNVAQTISPKSDRIVIFNGLTYHASSTPCDTDYRLVINYNWLP